MISNNKNYYLCIVNLIRINMGSKLNGDQKLIIFRSIIIIVTILFIYLISFTCNELKESKNKIKEIKVKQDSIQEKMDSLTKELY